jgi:hypothetical protein
VSETGGVLEVLNVGAGHLKLELDPTNPAEVSRAKRMVSDMLKRGYAIFVQLEGGKLAPVRKFDATRAVYVIEDVPGVEEMAVAHPLETTCRRCGRPKHRGRCRGRLVGPSRREVPMQQAKAVAVGRSAGG